MATTFTYGAGNPIGVPTVKPTPAKTPTPSKTTAKSTPSADELVTKLQQQQAETSAAAADVLKVTSEIEKASQTGNWSYFGGGSSGSASASSSTLTQNQPITTSKQALVPNVAYDTISKILENYGITDLASVLETIRKEYPEASSDDLMTLLQFDSRYNAKFNQRFSANANRMKAGMQVLSPAEYLAMEQGYKKIFDAYGLTKFKTQDYYNSFISGDVKVTEIADRVSLAYDRLLNDIPVQKAFKSFYSSLVTSDIISAMLDPQNQYPALERKVKAAEVGGAALRQGLTASELTTTPETTTGYSNVSTAMLGADVLAQQGLTKAAAEQGYSKVAQLLPTAEKLSSIYGGTADQYGRLEAEQEQLQGLASARRKREKISELEAAAFSKAPGIGKASLLGKSAAGLL